MNTILLFNTFLSVFATFISLLLILFLFVFFINFINKDVNKLRKEVKDQKPVKSKTPKTKIHTIPLLKDYVKKFGYENITPSSKLVVWNKPGTNEFRLYDYESIGGSGLVFIGESKEIRNLLKDNKLYAKIINLDTNRNQIKIEFESEKIAEKDKVYKKKGIKSFELKGISFNKPKKSDIGPFKGFAVCEKSPYDDYAVAIYNSNNKKLGYAPKNRKLLHESLKMWHNGKVECWGEIEYNSDSGYWSGSVEIPVGLTEEEIKNNFQPTSQK